VRLYNSTGAAIGNRETIWVGSPLSRTVTAGVCYIGVTGSASAYQIAATTNQIPPPSVNISSITATDLTADAWANGNIAAAGNEQWYKFTATANTQYIHYKTGTLNATINIQLYNAAGSVIGQQAVLTFSRPVKNGDIYYIKVKADSSTATGTYQIAFNTSSTAPTTP
jgi:hypothetical protein